MKHASGRGRWRARLVWAGASALVVHVAVYGLYTGPRLGRVRKATLLLERAQSAAEAATRDLGIERERVARLEANKRDVVTFFSKIIESPRVAMVPDLLEIEKAAAGAGLVIDKRDYDRDEIDEAPLVRVVTKVPATGRYQQVVDFLAALETSPRFIVVDRVGARAGEGGRLDLSVLLSTYYQAEPGSVAWEPPPGAAPTPRPTD